MKCLLARFLVIGSLLVGASMALGCGTTDRPELVKDQVAFVATGSDSVFRMNIDGSSVSKESRPAKTQRVWSDQVKILNGACGGVSADKAQPIQVFSPDGASLGPLDDNWQPEWSPDGSQVAVACGRDADNSVVVVGDVEQSGFRPDWKRSRHGSLSDKMEIYLVGIDGSTLTQLTWNTAGDWLPRWHPNGKYILIESNRDGNSEIYQLVYDATEFFRVTRSAADDQAPVWSRDGYSIAYASNVRATGQFEVYVARPGIGENFRTGQAGRPVPWVD
jgi:hypothetical protein